MLQEIDFFHKNDNSKYLTAFLFISSWGMMIHKGRKLYHFIKANIVDYNCLYYVMSLRILNVFRILKLRIYKYIK
jgi:hypothetical protein